MGIVKQLGNVLRALDEIYIFLNERDAYSGARWKYLSENNL